MDYGLAWRFKQLLCVCAGVCLRTVGSFAVCGMYLPRRLRGYSCELGIPASSAMPRTQYPQAESFRRGAV